MNAREKRFCDEYLIDMNATQAAIRAGYSQRTAERAGDWINKKSQEKSCSKFKPELRSYIDAQLEKIHSEKTADAKEVLEYLSSVMRGEQTEQVLQLCGEGKQTIVDIDVSAKERLKAAEMLGKAHGVFTDKVNLAVEPVMIVDDLKE